MCYTKNTSKNVEYQPHSREETGKEKTICKLGNKRFGRFIRLCTVPKHKVQHFVRSFSFFLQCLTPLVLAPVYASAKSFLGILWTLRQNFSVFLSQNSDLRRCAMHSFRSINSLIIDWLIRFMTCKLRGVENLRFDDK